MMKVCKRIIYTGKVQGVGFRYTAQGLAQNFSVSGYVRNVPDGSVELVAEGEASEVDAFLAAIAGRLGSYIDNQSVTDIEAKDLNGFEIRY